MNLPTIASIAISTLITCSLPATATCADLLGINGNNLIAINTDTLTVTVIGPIGFTDVGGLAFGSNWSLYGIASGVQQLISINPMTGAGTAKGGSGPDVTFSTDLAVDKTSGIMYGSSSTEQLITLSIATGARSAIGLTGAGAIVGLAFDSTGQLWGIDGAGNTHEELIRLDKFTAERTVVGPMGLSAYPGIGALAISAAGTFYAVNQSSSAYELLTINPQTGSPTKLGNLTGIPVAGGITGLTEAPEPNTMIYLVCALPILLRRRKNG